MCVFGILSPLFFLLFTVMLGIRRPIHRKLSPHHFLPSSATSSSPRRAGLVPPLPLPPPSPSPSIMNGASRRSPWPSPPSAPLALRRRLHLLLPRQGAAVVPSRPLGLAAVVAILALGRGHRRPQGVGTGGACAAGAGVAELLLWGRPAPSVLLHCSSAGSAAHELLRRD